MKLIIVRHGQTEENKKHIWQGHSEGMLSEEGKEQAERLAQKLKKENIDVIYCSDLKRTRDTIKPFLKESNIPIYYAKELRERNLGVLEGLKTELVEEYLKKNTADFENSNFETGETGHAMKKRLSEFYEKIVQKHKNDTVLFLTHGGCVAQLLICLFGYPRDRFIDYVPKNTGITKIEKKNGELELLVFNDLSHL
ncbi:MAG: histidine phosphatase family protein [Nanoarchaeota archaeon]|nr:histidine phosphatase family protein [Nanoarchaeota archaeon]